MLNASPSRFAASTGNDDITPPDSAPPHTSGLPVLSAHAQSPIPRSNLRGIYQLRILPTPESIATAVTQGLKPACFDLMGGLL
jgi:hypothetical protein